MRLHVPLIAALSLALLSAGWAESVSADPQQRRGPPPRAERKAADDRDPRKHSRDALSDAVRRAERNSGGEVLSAERIPYDGRDVSRIKVVDGQGRVRVYMDDPQKPAPSRPPRTRGDDD